MKARWSLAQPAAAAVDRLTRELGVSRVLATLLVNRGLADPGEVARFLRPALEHLHDPFRMRGMEAAVQRLLQAVARQETILIYGDYDVDGATAVIVLRKALELLDARTEFHIPHRIQEGYGMRQDVLDRAAGRGVGLVVSVDTGIRAAAVVEHARSLGVDCIITDHHLPEAELPPALAVLNPKQPGCAYPDKNLCGVGVAFKLADALFRRAENPARERLLESFLKIVAIGTIADVAPLTGENRVIARLGLAGLRRPKHPGLKALIAVAGLDGRSITSGDVGFRLAPRLNAAGRMDTALEVIRLFEDGGTEDVTRVAARLNELNVERQQAQERILAEIDQRIVANPALVSPPALIFEGEGWHRGVVGIAAGRLLEKYHRPVIVFSIDGDEAHGSGRSIPAFHLLDALDAISAESPGIFHRYGGHAVAVGCALGRARIPELRDRLTQRAAALLTAEQLQPQLLLDLPVRAAELVPELLEELDQLAPHGLANPAPLLGARDLELLGRPRTYKNQHLGLRLRQDGVVVDAMFWHRADLAPRLQHGQRLALAFHPERSNLAAGTPVRLIVKDLRVVG
jgi:single-stranded-DNA-specific exonuclease